MVDTNNTDPCTIQLILDTQIFIECNFGYPGIATRFGENRVPATRLACSAPLGALSFL